MVVKYLLYALFLIIGLGAGTLLTVIAIAETTPEPSQCVNETITKEIIKEVPIIKEVEVFKDCPKCEVCEDPIEISGAAGKLTLCNIRYDELNELYFKCLNENNTAYVENLTDYYNDCIDDLELCEEDLDNPDWC